MKRKKLIYNILLLVILCFIALGHVLAISPEEIWDVRAVLTVKVIILTLAYYVTIKLNVHVLVPRLLLHNRPLAYISSLLAFVLVIVAIEIGNEYILIHFYHVHNEFFWYFEENSILFFDILSPTIAYFISMAGTALFLLLHLWNQSGEKIHDLEEENTRSELEEVRTRIDSEALFSTLDKAVVLVRQSPAEVASLLMKLSKSLRIQLYESEYKPKKLQSELPEQTYNFTSPIFNFLTGKRYRMWHHLLLVTGFILISIDNVDGTWATLLQILTGSSMLLALVYLNIYVLVPKLLIKNRIKTYLVAVATSTLITVIPAQIIFFSDIFDGFGDLSIWAHFIFMISNTVKLCFPIIGVNAFLLFLHWVKNEKRIAELETATMISELEQLQSQVNPHFLFNMLNNVIVLTKTNPDEAAIVLRKLSDMLKYQFRGFTKQVIRLEDDIRFLTDYLNLEKLRRDNFEFSIVAENSVEVISLPPLLFIPFVENAVKHNNDNLNLSFVRLRFDLVNEIFCFECTNSKPHRQTRKDEVGGLGLPNVRRRLDLLYGKRYRLVTTESETNYSVQLYIEFKKQKIQNT